MQVVRQYDDGIDLERMIIFNFSEDLPQQIYIFYQQTITVALSAVDRKKIGCAIDFCSAVICHQYLSFTVG